MSKVILSFILILVCKFAIGQIRVIDSQDSLAIPFVHLISEGGVLVGTSNINGYIYVNNISKFIDER